MSRASIIDDGVACRLHERHFYVTATTGAASMPSTARCCGGTRSGAWTSTSPTSPPPMPAINIAGPHARAVLTQALQRHRPLGRGLSLHGRARPGTSPAFRCACCASASSASSATRSTARRAWARRCGMRLMAAGHAVRHPAVRRRGAARAAAGEGPHHRRPGHRRPHPSRTRPRWTGRSARASHSSSASASIEIQAARGLHAQARGLHASRAERLPEGMPPRDPRRRDHGTRRPPPCARRPSAG